MTQVKFTVNKANVYTEVAKTSSYSGAKMMDDAAAYDRIFTTDEDRQMLERFWNEASNAATELFKPFLVSVTQSPESHGIELARNYEATLNLSASYETALNASVESSLFSFFTDFIIAKWFKFTNKAEAESYGTEAASMLDDVKSKIYHKKKPTRVAPQ